MSIINKESLWTSYKNIETLNDIAGNLSASNMEERIDAQLGFVFEELSEAIESFEQGDAANFLKEVADVWVVTAGLLQIAEKAGFDVEAAMRAVDGNNLTKFPRKLEAIGPLPQGADVFFNDKYQRYTVRRAVDGKFLKPITYKKTDLTGIPVGKLTGVAQ